MRWDSPSLEGVDYAVIRGYDKIIFAYNATRSSPIRFCQTVCNLWSYKLCIMHDAWSIWDNAPHKGTVEHVQTYSTQYIHVRSVVWNLYGTTRIAYSITAKDCEYTSMRWSEWIECVLKERKEGSSWSVEVVVIAGLGRHFQLAGCRLLTARWDSVGCGEYVVQCMQFTDNTVSWVVGYVMLFEIRLIRRSCFSQTSRCSHLTTATAHYRTWIIILPHFGHICCRTSFFLLARDTEVQ